MYFSLHGATHLRDGITVATARCAKHRQTRTNTGRATPRWRGRSLTPPNQTESDHVFSVLEFAPSLI